jgi:metal-sulfur cluster biosynthetic enzyme
LRSKLEIRLVRACATGFSKLQLSRRVSAARANSATPDSIRLSGSAQSVTRERKRHVFSRKRALHCTARGQGRRHSGHIKNVVWQQLKTCYGPEIPINIVDLGLVHKCDVQKNADETRTVEIKMTLTAPGCGMGEVLVQDVRAATNLDVSGCGLGRHVSIAILRVGRVVLTHIR